jgi:uncharacterized protein DUF3558
MRVRPTLAFALVCLATTALASCSGTNAGTASTPSSATQPPTAALPSDGAPGVSNPIQDTSAVESDPCSAVANDKIATLNVKVASTRTEDMSPGQSCAWVLAGSIGGITGGLNVGNTLGLSSLYRQHNQGQLATFRPLEPVDGYPAVAYNVGKEGNGGCQLVVGVRNDLTYTVIAQLRDGNPYLNNPCELSSKLAGLAIAHLKGA